jgi:hypothetical protein
MPPVATVGSQDAALNFGSVTETAPLAKQDQGKTFALQHKLPKLPLPKLEDSMKRYLRALEGLQVRGRPPTLSP